MTKTRALASTIAGMALVGALATSPALAAQPSKPAAQPVILDGAQSSPAALQKLKAKGTKLYVVNAKAGQPIKVFTHKAAFKAYMGKRLGVSLARAPKKATAKAAWNGDYATFYQHYDGYGWGFNINSGYGQSDLSFVNCFLWWCSNYNDQISSVQTHGVPAILYSETGYRGSTYYVGANLHVNIPSWFNDYASSAYTYWNP